MYRSLARALVLSGKINTTLEKAKTLKVYMEKQISIAKRGTVPSRRKLYANLGNARAVADEIVRYVGSAGYIKIVPLPSRKGDAAKMARIEMVGWTAKEKKKEEPSFAKAAEGQGKKVKKAVSRKVTAKKPKALSPSKGKAKK